MTTETEAPPPVDRTAVTMTDGSPVASDHRELRPDGQQRGYVVLSEEERARGFVRPVRDSYVHVGPPPPSGPLRDLTPDEAERYREFGYVKHEPYDPPRGAVTGRFWTRRQLDRAAAGGCGTTTRMARPIAETYARDPKFYGGTFCVGCGYHLPVSEFVWADTDERLGS